VRLFESVIIADCLDDILTIIEHAANGNIENVLILQGKHLRRLEAAHFPQRGQHKNPYAVLAAHGIFRAGTGIAGGSPKNVQLVAGFSQLVLKQITEQLHGDILERQRRPIG